MFANRNQKRWVKLDTARPSPASSSATSADRFMKRKAWLWIILGTVVTLAVLCVLCCAVWRVLPPYVRGHLHLLTPRIQGTVTVIDGDAKKSYSFSDRGDYGLASWTLGTESTPVTVSMYNYNDWQVADVRFTVTRMEKEWQITGEIRRDGAPPRAYEDRIPIGEPIEIFFELY